MNDLHWMDDQYGYDGNGQYVGDQPKPQPGAQKVAFFGSRRIDEMSREELINAINYACNQINMLQRQLRKHMFPDGDQNHGNPSQAETQPNSSRAGRVKAPARDHR